MQLKICSDTSGTGYLLRARARQLAIGLLTPLILFAGGCGTMIAERALHPTPDPERVAMLKEVRSEIKIGWTGHFREFDYYAYDGTRLRAAMLLPPDPKKYRGLVVMVHGLDDQKEGMLRYAEGFADQGYVAVCPDLRAHGQSGGSYTTFGSHEKYDMVALLDTLHRQGYDTSRVGAVGASMGAAIVLQWAEIDHRVKAVVAVAPFAELSTEAMYLYHKLNLHFSQGELVYLVDAAQHLAHFRVLDVSPLRSVGKMDTPVYIVHGQKDPLIPPSESERLFEAARGPVVIERVPNGGHRSIVVRAGPGLLKRAYEWVDAFVPNDPGPQIAPAWASTFDHRNLQIEKAEVEVDRNER